MRFLTSNRPRGKGALGIVAAVLLASLCAVAADYSGKWSGTSPDDKSLGPVYAVLRQDGAVLTGSAGPDESHQFPITTGKVDGDGLFFDVKTGGGLLRFELTASAGDLKGTMRIFEDSGQTATANVVLKRIS